jgi:altered-inheritance-of-mitochondria protein 5
VFTDYDRMHNSAVLLNDSLDPSAPRAPAALIGPQYPGRPSFSDVLRIRWNHAIGTAVRGVGETDWTAVGAGVWEGGREVLEKLQSQTQSQAQSQTPLSTRGSETVSDARISTEQKVAEVRDVISDVRRDVGERVGGRVQQAVRGVEGLVAGAKEEAEQIKGVVSGGVVQAGGEGEEGRGDAAQGAAGLRGQGKEQRRLGARGKYNGQLT